MINMTAFLFTTICNRCRHWSIDLLITLCDNDFNAMFNTLEGIRPNGILAFGRNEILMWSFCGKRFSVSHSYPPKLLRYGISMVKMQHLDQYWLFSILPPPPILPHFAQRLANRTCLPPTSNLLYVCKYLCT